MIFLWYNMDMKTPLPTIAEGKAYLASCGWFFRYRGITRRYIFQTVTYKTLSFTMKELRDAVRFGF